jgi:structure-specific recognition protein 1
MSSTDQMKNINAHMVEFIKTHGGNDLDTFYEEHAESEVDVIIEEFTKLLLKEWNVKSNQTELSKLVVKLSEKKPKMAVMEEKGDDFKTSEVTSKLGAMWRDFVSEAEKKPKVKRELEKFQKMAADDKERYETEKADYTPLTEEELSEKLSSQKKKKDPNAPKRGKSAYMFFCAEYREKVKEELDDPKPTEVTTELGRQWNELKTDKKKKKELEKFEKMAAEDKERYQEEMAEYVPPSEEEKEEKAKKVVPKKGAVKGKASESKGSSVKGSSVKGSSVKGSSAKKPSAYTCFVKTQRPEMKEENPEMSGAEITKQLAKAWKEMDEEGKESWRERAEEEVEG